ncbi:MAG: T9SS type A sorting domain-containing protein [Candidatus Zixiibacteriota bacterium]
MMHKRTVYSLLLTSFILVFALSSAFSQSVTFESKSAKRCEAGVLNVTVNPGGSVNAIEVVFEVSSTGGGAFFSSLNVVWDPGFTELDNRIVDLSGVDNVSPDTVRVAAMATDPGDACLSSTKVVARVNFTTKNTCGGTVRLAGSSFTCPNNPLVVATTQFVDCADNSLIAAAVVAGTVTVVNDPPTINPISDTSLHWGTAYLGDANGNDPDLANGCEKLTYSKVIGPAGLNINSSTGVMVWATTGADVCTHPVTVRVTDSCGASAQTSFTICVFNDPPAFTDCQDADHACWGELVCGDVEASDPDGGPAPLEYSLVSFSGPGTVNVNPITGEWCWQTREENPFIGTFELRIKASDGANTCSPCSPSNADTCILEITVIPTFAVTIEKTHNTHFGQMEDVTISLDNTVDPGNPMGGYDFLIEYDPTALSFSSADPGQLIADCGWEYFTYRHGAAGNCGPGACPSGKVRIVAIAETNNGNNHPDCFGETPGASGDLVVLHFLVTNDYTFECQYVPIRFCWYDCGDNAISSKTGDTLFISRHVYDFDNPTPIEDLDHAFPSWFGANSSCDTLIGDGKPDPLRCADFYNGGVDIICVDSIDARGDINLDGLANTVADAVLFSNYFVYGLSVFTVNPAGKIAATDVNADGAVLTVADLVYLIRIIVGDALPIPKVVPLAVRYTHNNNGVMSVKDDVQIGAAFIVVSGQTTPTLLASNMDMQFNYDGLNTRILVWSGEEALNSKVSNSFTGDFLNVNGQVISIDMATFEGQPVALEVLPTEFALDQNYPNPFNPKTTVRFALPTASEWTLTVYNVSGQRVTELSGSDAAGIVNKEIDLGFNASGVYFYKLVAGLFTETKKMVLLK